MKKKNILKFNDENKYLVKFKNNNNNLLFFTNGRVLIWGVLHCRYERPQTQQAQYNEFGREAVSRTRPL